MQRLDRHRAAPRDDGLERHGALADDVEGVRLLALAQELLAGLEDAVARAARDQLAVLGATSP